MKKTLFLCGAAFAVMVGGAGCAMCNAPIPNDPNCIENTHLTDTVVAPLSLTKVAPFIVQTDRQFRPVFRAGTKVFGSGEGFSEEEALNAAISNILLREKCDYLVAVNHIATSKTHPTWRFFATTNYSVTISAIPIYLEKLEEEPIVKAAEPAVTPAPAATAAPAPAAPAEGTPSTTTVVQQPVVVGAAPCQCAQHNTPATALIRLTDIQVDVKAKGVAADNAGVVFPLSETK